MNIEDISKTSSKKFWLGLFVAHLVLRVATFYTRFLDIDETQFAGFAHVLMNGGQPYLDSLDTKPLGIYFFYRLCFEIFGRYNMIAVHAVTALIMFGSAFFLSRIFCHFDRKAEGRWAALFFVVASTTFIPKYLATSINSVMIFFLIVSAWGVAGSVVRRRRISLWLKVERNEKKHKFFWPVFSGIMLGLAFLFKYTSGIQLGLFFIASLFLFSCAPFASSSTARSKRWIEFGVLNFLFLIAFLIPFVLHGLYLNAHGVWPDFVEWSLLGSRQYIQHGTSTIVFWKSFFPRVGGYVLSTVFLWICFVWCFHKRMWQDTLFLFFFVWFCLSCVPVSVGGRFYAHYFLHLLPALCGLAAIGFVRINSNAWRCVVVGLMLASACFFWILRVDPRFFEHYFPDNRLALQKEVGKKVKSLAQAEDNIFVWGFATGVYFYSELRPASRFLWSDILTGRTPGPAYARINQDQEYQFVNPDAWKLFWNDLEKNKPQFFVDAAPANLNGYARFRIERYPELWGYLQAHYIKVEDMEGVGIYRRRD